MNSNVQIKHAARELRKGGKSYSEIMQELNVPKSSLSYWLKDIELTEKQNADLTDRLSDRMSKGRLKTTISLRNKRLLREKTVNSEAQS